MKKTRGKLLVFLLTLMTMFTMSFAMNAAAKDVIIVIDPGHGGSESGAYRAGYKEEVINQKIANYLKQELLTYEGVKVYMTRTSVKQAAQLRDERVHIAKQKNADVLVSIHINATANQSQTSVSGAFVAVPSNKFTSKSADKARKIASNILKGLKEKAGTKNNGYWFDDELGIIVYGQKNNYTNKEAKKYGIAKSILNRQIPTMIVEHCFIDNPNDRKKFLSSNAKLKKLAEGDAYGLAKFYRLKKKTANNQSDTEPVKTGLVKEDGNWYLYGTDGEPKTGLIKYNSKYYYAEDDGILITGWKKIGSKHYYFGKTTHAGLVGLQKIGKYKYYFKNGYYQTKWVEIDGLQYYFSKANGRLLTNYWLKWDGKWYYLNANGTPWKSCTKKIGGKKYKFNAQGICTNK